ncbi:2937_t:CDS:10 [Funneliformis mosseae]|uniref:2937_t:CDS:1 n=1 Tax=Funneliformis mosseae TaxID=27381 RepID=A0A9N9CF04_FUNMO|nr:2937_t:CDS:10 [Funneliformis mosseae]
MSYSNYAFGRLTRYTLKVHNAIKSACVCSNSLQRILNKRFIRLDIRNQVTQADNLALRELRPYQKECIETCLSKFLDHKINRQVVSLPVGSGKTVIFSNLIKQIPSPFPGADKVLVLAHREELLDQAYKQISKYSNLSIEIDQGGRIAKGNANVIIGSMHTLGKTETIRIEKYNPAHFKAIIIDEAHHATAASYRRILEYFGANKKETHLFVWGCSATVRRYDGLALKDIFDEITYHKDFLDMIQEKWLCNLRVTTIKTDVDLSKVKSSSEDFIMNDLSKYLNVESRNDVIVRTYLELAAQRTSTLVFGIDISHVESLTEMFRKRGVMAHGISSKTKPHIRATILKEFKERKFPVLVNCGILTEGTDIPNIDCIILSRPTKSPVLFQQMIGRGMRLSPEKDDCLVLDFIDSYSQIPDLATTPTLLGLDPTVELKDENFCEYDKEKPEKEKPKIIINAPTKIRITEYSNPFEIIDECSGAQHIQKFSDNAWLRIGEDSYVLSLQFYGTLKIVKENEIYYVTHKKREYPRHITKLPITSDSLESMIHACDKWIKATYGLKYAHIVASRFAKWPFEERSSIKLDDKGD